jgi:hypothetical protein
MNGRRRINVAVVGDRGVGKTSLITSAAQEVFSERPVPVLPPTRFPADFAVVSEPVDVIAFDTSSRPEDAQAVDETIRAADVVIVCFDAQRKSTLQRLRSDWLPRITHLRPAAPVIIACCKDDTEDTLPTDQIREVGTCKGHREVWHGRLAVCTSGQGFAAAVRSSGTWCTATGSLLACEVPASKPMHASQRICMHLTPFISCHATGPLQQGCRLRA